jgi:hypothetical protein
VSSEVPPLSSESPLSLSLSLSLLLLSLSLQLESLDTGIEQEVAAPHKSKRKGCVKCHVFTSIFNCKNNTTTIPSPRAHRYMYASLLSQPTARALARGYPD